MYFNLCDFVVVILVTLICRTTWTKDIRSPAKDAIWQPVSSTSHRFYVYSAFKDFRNHPKLIRIIAATRTKNSDSVECTLFLNKRESMVLQAQVKIIHENWNMKYTAAFVLCFIPRYFPYREEEITGATISVTGVKSNMPPTLRNSSQSSNHLIIQDTVPVSQTQPDLLHVCVKPFHFSYSRVDWLIEWLEVQQILGATHFYMYNESVSENVGCLLKNYANTGLITLLPWKLPLMSKLEIRTEGLFAAFNDCLYRSMARAQWLLILDVDEVVFPKADRSLAKLIERVDGNSTGFSALIFRNVFFYMEWEDDPSFRSPLITARKTRRKLDPNGHRKKTKYAVRTRDAIELGNHYPWRLMNGTVVLDVSIKKAVVHHYRIACESKHCLTSTSVVDRTAHRFADTLLERYEAAKRATQECVKRNVYYKLHDGYRIPAMAIGTNIKDYGANHLTVNLTAVHLMQAALDAGFEHIDVNLFDESEIGYAMKYISLNRDDIFITVKFNKYRNENVASALQDTLNRLGTRYVNLFLYKFTDTRENLETMKRTWTAMEVTMTMNMTRSIGLEDCTLSQMKIIWNYSLLKPTVVKLQLNSLGLDENVLRWCQERDIVVMVYLNFDGPGQFQKNKMMKAYPILQQLCKKYRKTVAQICLRYLVERNIIPSPKPTNPDLIREYFNVFDFSLTDKEVSLLTNLSKGPFKKAKNNNKKKSGPKKIESKSKPVTKLVSKTQDEPHPKPITDTRPSTINNWSADYIEMTVKPETWLSDEENWTLEDYSKEDSFDSLLNTTTGPLWSDASKPQLSVSQEEATIPEMSGAGLGEVAINLHTTATSRISLKNQQQKDEQINRTIDKADKLTNNTANSDNTKSNIIKSRFLYTMKFNKNTTTKIKTLKPNLLNIYGESDNKMVQNIETKKSKAMKANHIKFKKSTKVKKKKSTKSQIEISKNKIKEIGPDQPLNNNDIEVDQPENKENINRWKAQFEMWGSGKQARENNSDEDAPTRNLENLQSQDIYDSENTYEVSKTLNNFSENFNVLPKTGFKLPKNNKVLFRTNNRFAEFDINALENRKNKHEVQTVELSYVTAPNKLAEFDSNICEVVSNFANDESNHCENGVLFSTAVTEIDKDKTYKNELGERIRKPSKIHKHELGGPIKKKFMTGLDPDLFEYDILNSDSEDHCDCDAIEYHASDG